MNPVVQVRKWSPELAIRISTFDEHELGYPLRFGEFLECLYSAAEKLSLDLVVRDFNYVDFIGIPFVWPVPNESSLDLAVAGRFCVSPHRRGPSPCRPTRESALTSSDTCNTLTAEHYLKSYFTFLSAMNGAPRFRYEDIVTDPQVYFPQICSHLGLRWDLNALERFASIDKITGNPEGSKESVIREPRKPTPPCWPMKSCVGSGPTPSSSSRWATAVSSSATGVPPQARAALRLPTRQLTLKCTDSPTEGSRCSFSATECRAARRRGRTTSPWLCCAVLGRRYVASTTRTCIASYVGLPASCVHAVLKCHSLDAAGLGLAQLQAAKVVYTWRDLADATASFMTMFDVDFEHTIALMSNSLDLYRRHRRNGALILSYEAITQQPTESVAAVACLSECRCAPRAGR